MTHDALPDAAVSKRSQPEIQQGETATLQSTPEKLQFANVVAGSSLDSAAEASARPFRPSSASIDSFIENQSYYYGLEKKDLKDIAASAYKANNPELGQVATYLYEHFGDIATLSAHGGSRMNRDDLNLYSQMLKQSESNIAAGKPLDSGMQNVHYDHQNQAGSLQGLGTLVGLYGGHKLYNLLANNPVSLYKTLAEGPLNPKVMAVRMGVRLGSYAAGMIVGSEVGGMVSRGMQEGTIRKHYTDEAEPAMKRLFKE